jgi:hypothetical protein
MTNRSVKRVNFAGTLWLGQPSTVRVVASSIHHLMPNPSLRVGDKSHYHTLPPGPLEVLSRYRHEGHKNAAGLTQVGRPAGSLGPLG